MKLSTILLDGQARAAMVITNAMLRCQCCLDLVKMNQLLETSARGWLPAPIPGSVLGIIQGGQEALDNLKRLEERLMKHLERRNTDVFDGDVADDLNKPDRAIFDQALVPAAAVRWLPPIPDIPLFITFHGNGIQLWRDRLGPQIEHVPPRVPTCRLHPITSLLGHEEALIFPRGHVTGFSNELGVILAPGGRNIPYEEAHRHIWGVTNCNDATRSAVWPMHFGRPMGEMVLHEKEGRARLGRASDAASAFGPWITTADEVPNVHDLLLRCWGDDGSYCRAHSSTYIMGPRNALDYFSRFMTIPAGTGLQFGAPGTDGVGGFRDMEQAHGKTCQMDMEHVGMLQNGVECEDLLDDRRRPGEGWYGLITRRRTVDLARIACPDRQPFPRHTRSLWGLRYNDRRLAEQAEYAPDRQRHHEIYPPNTLSTGEAVELPACGAEVEVSCELAAVVGERQLACLQASEVCAYLAGITILIGLRDYGLAREYPAPTRREALFGEILGRWYDGCNAMRPDLSPVADLDELGDRRMQVAIEGIGDAVTHTGDYLQGFAEAISFMSREITFLPGDVISLGSAGQFLKIPAERPLPEGTVVRASIEGIGAFTVPLIDHRKAE